MDRRQFVQVSLLAASGGALAGCVSASGRGETGTEFPTYEIPDYSVWPPDEPRTNDFVLFGHLNIQILHEPDDEDEDESTAEEDVLVTLPGYGASVTALWFYLGVWGYPWDGILGSEDEPDGMATDALTMTEGTLVFHGEYDAGVFTAEYADGFDVREANGFTVLEGRAGEETDLLAYAVAEDVVVAAIAPADVETHEQAVGNLDDALGNRIDETGRVVDSEDGEWLFETTGPADMVTGFWRVDGLEEADLQSGDESETDEETTGIEDNPLFANVDSFISTGVLPESEGGVGEDVTAARFAALYPDGDVPSKDVLRDELAPTISEEVLDVITTDDRAYVAAQAREDRSDQKLGFVEARRR